MCKFLILWFILWAGMSLTQKSEQTFSNFSSDTFPQIRIGTQTWMTENLNVTTFRNGDPIPEAKTVEEWKKAGENKQPAWCYYKNKSKSGIHFGKLYNWYAIHDQRNIAPLGWHIPTDEEWTLLSTYIGEKENVGIKLKSTEVWSKNGKGTNEFGFSGLPSGYRYFNGYFYGIGNYGFWWSATEKDEYTSFSRFLYVNYVNLGSYHTNKSEGLSVRCIKD
jgi:uncharacterized protein (TIGR02145 family)